MANVCAAPTTPAEIRTFFQRLYEKEPEVSQVKKNTIFSLAQAEVSVQIDAYKGCHVEVGKIFFPRIPVVQKAIENLAEELRKTKTCNSLWINLPFPVEPVTMGVIPNSFVMGKSGQGDLIRDEQQKKLRVWQWLNPDKECSIPPGATHNIGATALLCDTEAQKILLVVNQMRPDKWNLPGGSFDPSQDKSPMDTAFREAQEEGGIVMDRSQVNEPKLIGQIQFPQNQFAPSINQIWSFAMPGISKIKLNPPVHEIKRAAWVGYQEVLNAEDKLDGFGVSDEIKGPLLAAIQGLGAREIANKGWMIVHAPVQDRYVKI